MSCHLINFRLLQQRLVLVLSVLKVRQVIADDWLTQRTHLSSLGLHKPKTKTLLSVICPTDSILPQVKTKKGVSAAHLSHPNSRKVQQLTKQVKKEAARKKSKLIHQMKQNLVGEKFLWFRDNLPEGVTVLDQASIADIIQRYLARFDEELDQIRIKHSIGNRKNRQHANREDVILLTKLQEEKEYLSSGIELPNLLQPSQVEMLRKWNGELRFLQNFKLRRFSKNFLETSKKRLASPSTFSNNANQCHSDQMCKDNLDANSANNNDPGEMETDE